MYLGEKRFEQMVSKLNKNREGCIADDKKERRDSDVYLAGTTKLLNLKLAVSKHLHVTGKVINGLTCRHQLDIC